jgi:23S rRNA (cytidine1920-2'-O)/16S rRNA (cytidine1409-2'-O)-methyltransferase
VTIAGVPATKAATLVGPDAAVAVSGDEPEWAGRGAHKLLAALDGFGIDPEGSAALDVGASTGGFTDVLVGRGAASVTALDVGYGQLIWRLRTDHRVTVLDRVNFRTADPHDLGGPFDLVVVDVSFISVRLLAPNLAAVGAAGSQYVVLVKPQFEAGRERVGRGGVVTDPDVHTDTIDKVAAAMAEVGLGAVGLIASPITGAKGNREFLLHCVAGAARVVDTAAIREVTG